MEGTKMDWREMLTDYIDSNIELHQMTMEPPNNTQTYDGQGQSNLLDSTGDTSERLHAVNTEGRLAAPRASVDGLDNLKNSKAGVETQSHMEETKDELKPPALVRNEDDRAQRSLPTSSQALSHQHMENVPAQWWIIPHPWIKKTPK